MRKQLLRIIVLLGIALLPMTVLAAADTSVHALDYSGPSWSPYVVGASIGVLAWLTFYFSDNPIGASSFYAHIAGFIGRSIAPIHTKSLAYFEKKPPKVSWEFVFVVAAIFGGAIAALTGGEFTDEWLPPMWDERFGESIALRAGLGFTGGVLMAIGARLAGGCTSGHGISGTMQLNPGAWITVICLFIGGIIVAFPLYLL